VRHKAALLVRFDRFVENMTKCYAEVRACLERDDYVGAQRILAQMGVRHAKTSLSLRNVLIKNGDLNPEDK
jgi:hypothetical protein